ncbi:MAG: response regulator [Isosphaeraceae bacterium]|nr:response regulator [Isosphaeraceae bacterium]
MNPSDPVDTLPLATRRPLFALGLRSDPRRLATARALQERGRRVVSTTDGLEFYDLVARHDPLVAICDLHLPSLGGFEIASRLRRRESKHEPVLIAWVEAADADPRLEALASGFDFWVDAAPGTDPTVIVEAVELGLAARNLGGLPRAAAPLDPSTPSRSCTP